MDWHKELSVVLVVAVLLQHADCLECYSCSNVTHLAECNSLQQCPPGSVCFSTFRSNKHTLGCNDASDCPDNIATMPSPHGGSGSIIGRAIIDSCSQCCTTNNCNRQLCQASDPDCQDSGEISCAQVSALLEVCSNTDHAKKVCKKFCGLCDLVDGAWTDWNSWSACSVSCSNGTVTRTRSCTNPSPASGGNDCLGISHETSTCVKDTCPVHGGWSDWSSWGTCSVSCGIGQQRRDRSCSRPYPAAFGDHCFGDSSADRICFTAGCQDGGWSTWTAWSSCSQTCGGGLQKRSRACTNPPPSLLGRSCSGDPLDVKDCTHNACQEHYVGFSVADPKILNSTHITFTQILANVGNRYNTATGTFTCKTPGYYFFSLAVLKTSSATSIQCDIQKEGHTISGHAHTNPQATGMWLSASTSAYVILALGDRVTTRCTDSSHIYIGCCSSFTGYMAHAD